MSLPRNNLDDILRKRAPVCNTTVSSNAQQHSTTARAKFRAATAAPSTPVRSSTLPSTGAVRSSLKTHAPSCPPQTSAKTSDIRYIARSDSPIPVSSGESSPVSNLLPAIPTKRASPQSAYNPPAKRPKSSSHKENLCQASFDGKVREYSVDLPDFGRVTSTSRPAPSTPNRPPPSHATTLSNPCPGDDSKLAAPGTLRGFEFDYSGLLNLSIEELEELKKDVVNTHVKWMEVISDMPPHCPATQILQKINSIFLDLPFCAQELIRAHKEGDRLLLPQSKWTVSTLLKQVPLQPIDALNSPARTSRSRCMPTVTDAQPFLELPAEHSTATASFHSDLVTKESAGFAMPSSDDMLWGNMDEPTQDELDFEPAPQPPSSQQQQSTISTLSSSSSAISALRKTSDLIASDLDPPQPNPTLLKTPFYPDLVNVLRNVFGLSSFRYNQLEAISAYMEGKDVFVLMPTGGGKSLCFQLPAVIKNRQCNAVTFVVSPLVSLMTDQVSALRDRGISVAVFSHKQTNEERNSAFAQLMDGRPGRRACLAYVTPELLQQSEAMKRKMDELAVRDGIAGFVVDEAHCIPTWGRGFRESYLTLSSLRDHFPKVPIMALTATATQQSVRDIVHRLKIPGCKLFRMSFNRPNLTYAVKVKNGKDDKGAVVDMVAWIKKTHANETGIVYCSSRKKCEKIAEQLRNTHGLSAEHYHAEVDADEKERVQQEWQQGKIKIIVATIAFGMGIDKADVRFVVHLHMPLSLSNYYQETGRAGRDGLPADCRLYYSYQDAKYPITRAREEANNTEDAEAIITEIRRVVEYCQNDVDCRRSLVLAFFDEVFDPTKCRRTCDNCMKSEAVVERDLTEAAKNMIELARELNGRATRVQLIDVFIDKLGRASLKFLDVSHKGCGKDLPRDLAERLYDHLCGNLGVLHLIEKRNKGGWSNSYTVLVLEKADEFLQNNTQVILRYKPPPPRQQQKRPGTKKGKARAERHDTDESQAGPSRQRRQGPKPVVEIVDDPIEEYDGIDDITVQSFWEDDNDISVESPSKTLQPKRTTRSIASGSRSIRSAVQILESDSDVEIVESEVCGKERDKHPDTWGYRLEELKKQRDKLEAELGHSIRDVFGDAELELISLALPSDVKEFEQHLRTFGTDIESSNIKHIPSFLQVIVPFKTAQRPAMSSSTQQPKARLPTMSQLHRQYDYQGSRR